MTKPIKDYRFICAEGCRPGQWTSYHKAIRDMKNHGMNRKRGQGHGGSVFRRTQIRLIGNKGKTTMTKQGKSGSDRSEGRPEQLNTSEGTLGQIGCPCCGCDGECEDCSCHD